MILVHKIYGPNIFLSFWFDLWSKTNIRVWNLLTKSDRGQWDSCSKTGCLHEIYDPKLFSVHDIHGLLFVHESVSRKLGNLRMFCTTAIFCAVVHMTAELDANSMLNLRELFRTLEWSIFCAVPKHTFENASLYASMAFPEIELHIVTSEVPESAKKLCVSLAWWKNIAWDLLGPTT